MGSDSSKPNGPVTRVGGDGTDGFLDSAAAGGKSKFGCPIGIAHISDAKNGVTLYIADSHSHRIRKWTKAENRVSTFVGSGTRDNTDGTGTAATLSAPLNVCVDPSNPTAAAFASDCNSVCSLNLASGELKRIAGTGTFGFVDSKNGGDARFNGPTGMAYSPKSGLLFVCDTYNSRLRVVDTKNGGAVDTALSDVSGIKFCAWDKASNYSVLYFTCSGGVRRFNVDTKEAVEVAKLGEPTGIDAVDSSANSQFIVACAAANNLFLLTPSKAGDAKQVATIVPLMSDLKLNAPHGLTVVESEKAVYVADKDQHVIQRIQLPSSAAAATASK